MRILRALRSFKWRLAERKRLQNRHFRMQMDMVKELDLISDF